MVLTMVVRVSCTSKKNKLAGALPYPLPLPLVDICVMCVVIL